MGTVALDLSSARPQYVQRGADDLVLALDDSVPPKGDDDLLIATWNIRDFGRYTPKWRATASDTPKRDLRSLLYIATIVARFDIVALQEVGTNTAALVEVVRYLNELMGADRWQFVVSDPSRKSDETPDERLGYLWDASRVTLSGLVGEIVLPARWSKIFQVAVDEDELPDGADPDELMQQVELRQFARTPYAVGFRSSAPAGPDFVLTTLHVRWGSDQPEDFRIWEVEAIARWLDMWAREDQAWDADIITLGDFNIDRLPPLDPHGELSDEEKKYRLFSDLLTIPPEMHAYPRTVFGGGQNKHYDQIAWFGGADGGPGFSLRFHESGFFDHPAVLKASHYDDLTLSSYTYRMSDHYPLWARFTSA